MRSVLRGLGVAVVLASAVLVPHAGPGIAPEATIVSAVPGGADCGCSWGWD